MRNTGRPDTEPHLLGKPELPTPSCRVILVNGPPGAGKTYYCQQEIQRRTGQPTTLIDFDLIGMELGHHRLTVRDHVKDVLRVRNRRLEALSKAPADQIAFVTMCLLLPYDRTFWQQTLNVQPEDMILIQPPWDVLVQRVQADPTRAFEVTRTLKLARQWYDDPSVAN